MRGAVVSRRLPSLRFTSQDSSSVRVLGHLGPTGLALGGFHDRSSSFADCIVPGTINWFNVSVPGAVVAEDIAFLSESIVNKALLKNSYLHLFAPVF
jgi:hypothetical protein